MAQHNGKFVSYLRVSTVKQEASGLGIEGQRAAVEAFLNGGNWRLVAEFIETESGKDDANRPELAKALAECRLCGATLVIAKLDRLSRDAHFLLGLQKADVRFVCADMPNANDMTVGIMAVVAREERKMISERTKAALQAAKARGTVLGGFRGYVPDHGASLAVRAKKADAFAGAVKPVIEALQAEGKNLSQIAAALTARGIETARHGEWTAKAVSRLLDRKAAAAKAA